MQFKKIDYDKYPSQEQIDKDKADVDAYLATKPATKLPAGVASSALFFYKGHHNILQAK